MIVPREALSRKESLGITRDPPVYRLLLRVEHFLVLESERNHRHSVGVFVLEDLLDFWNKFCASQVYFLERSSLFDFGSVSRTRGRHMFGVWRIKIFKSEGFSMEAFPKKCGLALRVFNFLDTVVLKKFSVL